MKALYDLSFLGYALGEAGARTGLARFIEELGFALRGVEGVTVEYAASAPFFASVREYMAGEPRLAGAVLHAGRHPVSEASARLRAGLRRTAVGRQNGKGGLATRVRRKALFLADNALRRGRDVLEMPAPLPDAAASCDVYHSPYLPLPPRTGAGAAVRVLTVHDLIPRLFPDLCTDVQRRLLERTLSSIGPEDWVLADSEHTRADLCEHVPSLTSERVHVAYAGADRGRFFPCSDAARIAAARDRYGIPPDVPYLLSLSAKAPHKNLGHVVRCFARLVADGEAGGADGLRLVLAGPRSWKPEALDSEMARFLGSDGARGLAERIILTGFVDDADLAPLYTGATAFLFLSLYEGFGLPPLEAMCCGTPVVASNASSIPEVVGDAGILLDPRDEDGLAHALVDLCARPERRAALATRALDRSKEFSWERCAWETVAAYRAALGARAA